eukprot:COSAG02_NODE_1089_length_14662_cov_100.768180_15_plen_80_part_00
MDTYAHPNYAPAWVSSFECQAGVGLEYPAYSQPDQVTAMFAMLTNLSHLRAIGTWGGVANDSSPMALAWYDGLRQFLRG